MSDLDEQLRQLFREKDAVVGPPPTLVFPHDAERRHSHARLGKVRTPIQLAAVAAVVALAVIGFHLVRSSSAPTPASAPTQTWDDALGDTSPLTMPKTLSPLPAQTNLPASVPDPNDDLPSLLNDPPGRVLMTWYAAPASGCSVQGWARESIDFYGQDRQWRRLNLDDLGLPDSTWPGCQSNGPGALSPDGRWWTIGARGLFVLLNLETGELVTKRSPTSWGGTWTQDSQQLVKLANKGAGLWTVPGVYVMDMPGIDEPGSGPLPIPGGGFLSSDRPTRSNDPDGGSMTLRYYTSNYELMNTREVPIPSGSRCYLEGIQGDRVGMVCWTLPAREPHIFYVLDESSWRVEAALEVPNNASAYPAGWLNPGLWVLSNDTSVGLWQIDDCEVGTVLPLPDEAKSAKWYSFNQMGLAGDLITD